MASKSAAIVNASLPILFLGASAAIQMIASCMYLKCKPDFEIVFAFSIITIGIYLLNRVVDKEDKFNNLSRWMFFNKNPLRTALWLSFSIFLILEPVILCLVEGKQQLGRYFTVIAMVGILYSIKGIPIVVRRQLKWISIKDIPFLKSVIVCIVWGCSGMILTAVSNNLELANPEMLLILTIFTICTLNSTVTADSRDIEGDKVRSIITLPVLFGESGALKILTGINLLAFVTILCCGIIGYLNLRVIVFSCVCILISYASIIPQYFKNIHLSKTLLELSVDSYIVTTSLILCLVSL